MLSDADAWKRKNDDKCAIWMDEEWVQDGKLKSLTTSTIYSVCIAQSWQTLSVVDGELCEELCTDRGASCMRHHQSVLIRVSCLQALKPRPRSGHWDVQLVYATIHHYRHHHLHLHCRVFIPNVSIMIFHGHVRGQSRH